MRSACNQSLIKYHPTLVHAARETDCMLIASLIRYHPTLVRAAREAAAPLGPSYAAMHVRRGDKAVVDKAYVHAIFGGKMTTDDA